MRTLRHSIKKSTPRRAVSSAGGAFRRLLTPVSAQQPITVTEEKRNSNCRFSTTPNLKGIQRLLQYTPPPQVIPATPAERSKVSSASKLRSRHFKRIRANKHRQRTRILISASLAFLYYCKSGDQTSIPNKVNSRLSIRGSLHLLAKAPSILESPSTTYEKFLSLKRKTGYNKVSLGERSSKRLRVEGIALREGLTEASERLQSVPPYPTAVTQTKPNFTNWQNVITEASERLQSVPPYPTPLSINLPVAVTQSVKNFAERFPVIAAAMKQNVKNFSDEVTEKVHVAAVGQFNTISEGVSVRVAAMKKNVKNLTMILPVAETRQFLKKWTRLPLPAYSHPLLQQKQKQEKRRV
ncbi:unnamed protein product [Cylindrotheca closterium]|uniref:Uncharacterized protein n=1 Tax=Cylindrotheca closterium TaxID=2856 RepID=A0AAD2FN09_9STRA|nr:unnamed protein product [Cylindrotheca closterium]